MPASALLHDRQPRARFSLSDTPPAPPQPPCPLSVLPSKSHIAPYGAIQSISKILQAPSGTPFSPENPDSTLSDLDPLLPSSAHASADDAHNILWVHFGFIPPGPDLVLDGYKLPSPSPSLSVAPRILAANPSLSRTSPSISPSSLPSMSKKRRSLQAILVPSFLPQSSASASALSAPPCRPRSHTVTSSGDIQTVEYSPDWLSFYAGAPSPHSELSAIGPVTPSRNSPPPDLLDEDPFANLSPAPSVRGSRTTSPVRAVFDVFNDGPEAPTAPPRSPLAQHTTLPDRGSRLLRHASSFASLHGARAGPSTPPPTPTESSNQLLRRPKSSGPPQVRPAYTRPAFAPRPSLPSLNTLARTSIHVPKVRRGRPGAHLPLEPWEDSASPVPFEPPSPTRSVPTSPIARRRGHLRRPTLSMIRDSRMYLDNDGENAEGIPRLEPEEKEPSSARDTPTPTGLPVPQSLGGQDRGDVGAGSSFLSISPEEQHGGFGDNGSDLDDEQPPTPPPKSPSILAWHVRSASQTSVTSTSTVPSLCPSSPTSTSCESIEPLQLRPQSRDVDFHPQALVEPLRSYSDPLPPVHTPPRSRGNDHLGPASYPAVFAHQRHTQFLTSDLLASLEYDYSEALSQLSVAGAATDTSVPLAPSGLFPGSPSPSLSGEFEPGSSAGTIRNIAQARIQHPDDAEGEHPVRRVLSDASAESKWSNEATEVHTSALSATAAFARAPLLSPLSPPELPSSSSEASAASSPARSPSLAIPHSLSRASSFSTSASTVSSEYDFGEDEYAYYSYDIGAFADPLGSPPADVRRPVFGYGIPWPSTHRASAVSAASGGSTGSGGSNGSGGSGASMSDVLSDLEDLAEDLTERFSLAMHSSLSRSGSGSACGDDYGDPEGERDVFSDDGGSLVDAPEGDSGSGSRRGGRPSGGSGQGGYSSSSYAGYGSSSNGYGYAGGGGFRRGSAGAGGDEDDDDDERRRRPARQPLPLSSRAAAASDTSEDEDGSESDYGESSPPPRRRERHDTTRPGAPASVPVAMSRAPAAVDDDVPLARQIPTALKAQRTIRRQVRDELDQKREERRAQRAQQALLSQQQQLQPLRAQSSAVDVPIPAPAPPPTGSSPPRPAGRPRTKTLPSTMNSPFSVGDLTRKLLGLQSTVSPTTAAPPVPQSSALPSYPRSKRPSLDSHDQHSQPHGATLAGPSMRGRTVTADPYAFPSTSRQASRPPPPEPARSLRPMRSFHRPRAGDADAHAAPPALPSTSAADQPLQRRATTASRRPPDEPPSFLASAPPSAVPADQRTMSTLDRARSVRSAKSSRRPSLEKRPEPDSSRSRSATTSAGASANATPASTFSQPGKSAGQTMWQQRVFIGNMQRFCLVELGGGTCAGDVLSMVDAQGALEQGAGSGGWMLWEVSQDFGMERPIRSFEMLSEVCGAWNADKTVNLLVIKKTLLAPLLSTKAMPSSSPVCSGYVQWEYKRGKWQKRWMELREHSLWLAKRDTGKDATFLCSLNNFDAYYVTRVHKSPKPYVFSVKSTDSLSFFENTADYVHVFSCGEGEGKNWLEKILLARSYVLYQERSVISNTSGVGAGAPGGGLQRAGTRRQPGQRPAQTLVSVTAPKADPMSVPNSFEPAAGSLLARRH